VAVDKRTIQTEIICVTSGMIISNFYPQEQLEASEAKINLLVNECSNIVQEYIDESKKINDAFKNYSKKIISDIEKVKKYRTPLEVEEFQALQPKKINKKEFEKIASKIVEIKTFQIICRKIYIISRQTIKYGNFGQL
jgi:hypothetical protein